MLAAEPADVTLPLRARDDRGVLANILGDMARRHDVIVTVGGASVGDHDHVRGALDDAGGQLDFWKIAMRPGKPLIAGRIGDNIRERRERKLFPLDELARRADLAETKPAPLLEHESGADPARGALAALPRRRWI